MLLQAPEISEAASAVRSIWHLLRLWYAMRVWLKAYLKTGRTWQANLAVQSFWNTFREAEIE